MMKMLFSLQLKKGWTLQYASRVLQNNKEFILKAVKNNGWILEYLNIELKNDKEIIIEAVKNNVGYKRFNHELLKEFL